tara:strand:+ start:954 stop:1610 length:657 start_codon:yes stop_codon:yes gene_type:complete
MKKYKVIICIPTFVSVHAELFDQFMKLAVWADKNDYPILTVPDRTHNDARNWLATGGGGFSNSRMLINMTDTFVWIDSDMVFTHDDLEQLIEHEHPFVSGVYYKGQENKKIVMAAKWDEEKFLKTGQMNYLTESDIKDARGKPIQVSYVGFGFCKTDSFLLEKMSYPYFTNKVVTIKNEKHVYTENCSEDASFCLDSSVKPIIDTKLIIGHYRRGVIR